MEPDAPSDIVLASASPRRRELMAVFGLPYRVEKSEFVEPTAPDVLVDMPGFVQTLALRKAEDVARRQPAGVLVIGADTEVAVDASILGRPLGKPADREGARRMLRELAGRSHTVYTGVALVRSAGSGGLDAPIVGYERTLVTFRDLSDAMIERYIDTGEPFDKAGGYGAQGRAAPFIQKIDGDFFNVVGLPVCLLGQLLERAGIEWWRGGEAELAQLG